jgi:hypothetical protein
MSPEVRLNRRVRFALLLVLLASLCVPVVTRAQELVPPRVKDRKFPSGVWCPMGFDVTFVADGPMATLRFSTNVSYFSDNTMANEWTREYLDNVCVAPKTVYDANTVGAPPESEGSGDCYFPHPAERLLTRFAFQSAGTLPLAERFDTNPAGRWDLDHGASWCETATAPNNPGPIEDDFDPAGCLVLGGSDCSTPAALDSAFTSVTVSGLGAGETYVLSGWWFAGSVELDKIFLTVRITGSERTPLVRRTWGSLKRAYR